MNRQSLKVIIYQKLAGNKEVGFWDEPYLAPANPLWNPEEMNDWLKNLGLPAPLVFRPCYATEKSVYWAVARFQKILGEETVTTTTETEFLLVGKSAPIKKGKKGRAKKTIIETAALRVYPSAELAEKAYSQNRAYAHDQAYGSTCYNSSPNPYTNHMPVEDFREMGGIEVTIQNRPLPEPLLLLQGNPTSFQDWPVGFKDQLQKCVVTPAGFAAAWVEPVYQKSWAPTSLLLNTIHTIPTASQNEYGAFGNLWASNLDAKQWTKLNDNEEKWRGSVHPKQDLRSLAFFGRHSMVSYHWDPNLYENVPDLSLAFEWALDLQRTKMIEINVPCLSPLGRNRKMKRAEEQLASSPQEEVVEELGWIVLDPAVPFAERLRLGNYEGDVQDDIAEYKSKLKRKVRRRIVVYGTQEDVSTEGMVQRIRKNGDRPCDLDDGLGIGETFPNRQEANSLTLLDKSAVVDDAYGHLCAPVLFSHRGKRRLNIRELAGKWDRSYRFPAVRQEEYLDS